MKKTKALSLLLSLSLLCSFIMPGASAYAVDGAEEDNGMQIQKTAMSNGDGTYTIQLEAYATGEKLSTEVKKDVPTDIVLVLDQSGSMSNDIGSVSFEIYKGWFGDYPTNAEHYENRHNGGNNNLYYPLDNGSYASVSVERTSTQSYNAFDGQTNSTYYNNRSNLYAFIDGAYQKVTVDRSGFIIYDYTYTLPDGRIIAESSRPNTTPNFNGIPLFQLSESDRYTYSYTDADGDRQVIGTSDGDNTRFPTALYEKVTSQYGGGSKLNALKAAVSTFLNSVSEKGKGEDGIAGTADDIGHRVAVVGFASTNTRNSQTYSNTEILSTNNVINYGNATSQNYKDALVPVNSGNNLNNRLTAAVSRLDASGDTYLEYGMDMANRIFQQNPIPDSDTSGRQRVVIVFTDGYPAPSGTNDLSYSMADNAIENASDTKKTYGATVYTVGVLSDADPTADIEDGFQYGGDSSSQQTVASNRYMHYVSSNYPDAVSLQNGGSLNSEANPFGGGDSYYLSAADADTLNNIFQQISDNIESGGSATTLGEETVIKDLVSEYFQLPAGTDADDITVQTVPCTEIVNDVPTWGTPETFTGARVTVDEDTGTVSVSGFDFAGNYVGMDKINGVETLHNPAKKLVISFKVEPKDGFLGGNGVPTNAGAYIYENEGADKPVLEFNKPLVDVLIDPITVTASDKNVYLLGDLTAEQIREGASVKVGDVELKLGETNYGLEAWQYDYVKIEVTYQDKDGNTVEGLNDLKEDTTYTVSVKVTPSQTQGQATERSGSDGGAINVYKPELTFQDSEVYYGETVSTDFTANKVSEIWKHGGTASTDAGVVMTGEAPTLDITYTFDETKIPDGKVNTKQDIPVKAEVKIDTEDVQQYTTFVHQDCNPACGWDATMPDGDPAFLLHVKTCKLTIIKTGGTDGEPYVFSIYKDGEKYSEVTIVGNSSETIAELPVGTYTIEEDTGWSWRYPNPTYSDDVIILDRENPQGIIICTNTKEHDYWLNGFSDVVKNVYGAATQYIR